MTCKDCRYFNKDEHPSFSLSVPLKAEIKYGYCEKRVADGYKEYPSPDCEICDMFEDTDGTYHNGTYHCGRCGRPTNAWGLCDECSRLYDSWESVTK